MRLLILVLSLCPALVLAQAREPTRGNTPPGMSQDGSGPADGAVNLIFYDRRDTEGILTGLTMARSIDGGRSFVNYRVDQKPFATDDLFLGDYIGIDAFGGRVVALYSHVMEKRQIVLSAALFHFRPGTQALK